MSLLLNRSIKIIINEKNVYEVKLELYKLYTVLFAIVILSSLTAILFF